MTPQEAVLWAVETARGRPITGYGPLAADAAAGHFNAVAPWSWSLKVLDPITMTGATSYTVLNAVITSAWSHVHLAQILPNEISDVRDLQVVGKVPTAAFDNLTSMVEANLTASDGTGDLILKPWPLPADGSLLITGKLRHTAITSGNWNSEILNHPPQFDYIYRLFVLYYVMLYANDQRAGYARPTPDGQGIEYTGIIGHAMVEAQRAAVSLGLILTATGYPKVN